MSNAARLLVIVVVSGTLLLATGVGLVFASITHAGTISVDVAEPTGDRVTVHVPAGVAEAAMWLVPDRVIDEAIHELDRELSRELGPDVIPALREAWDRIESSPDFVIVEVDTATETVLVEKVDGRLQITVDGDDVNVDISIPVRTIDRLLRKL